MKYHHMFKVYSILLSAFMASSAGIITKTVRLTKEDLSFHTTSSGDAIIAFPDAILTGKTGDPQIPAQILQFILPVDAVIEKVDIIDSQSTVLPGTYNLFPVQEPVTFSSQSSYSTAKPNVSVYSLKTLFPSSQVQLFSTSNSGGFKITGLCFYPIQYLPAAKTIRLTTSATIQLHYSTKALCSESPITDRQYSEFEPMIRKMVANPADMKKCAPQTRENKISDVNYAIITSASLAKEFEAFKTWKTKKGYKSEIVTTTWIYANYTGYDNAEKIRNFLIDYFKNRGLIYALLAGDVDVIPERDLDITKPMAPGVHEGKLASDMYYSDLDGTWDHDKDHDYCEINYNSFESGTGRENIDGLSDIFVGRAPVDNIADVKAFIHKDTMAEKHPVTENQKKFLLISTPINNGPHLQNMSTILKDTTTPGWFTPHIYINDQANRNSVPDSLTRGFSLCHIGSHGYTDKFISETKIGGQNQVLLDISDVAQLKNNQNIYTLFSMACLTGCYDMPSEDCIAEKLINGPATGCVAAILNSREGIGDIDLVSFKIVMGFAERLCIEFNSNFFKRNEHVIGKCHAATRNRFRDLGFGYKDSSENRFISWAWSVAEWTLFADPDLPLFQETPHPLSAAFTSNINKGQQTLNVKVTDANGPVADALVCCYKGDEVHATGKTANDGTVAVSINPASNGSMFVTATARNHTPYEGTSNIGTVPVNNVHAGIMTTALKSLRKTSSGTYALQYTLAEPSDVTIALYSINGTLLNKYHQSNCSYGNHELTISDHVNGMYLLTFTAGNNQIKSRIMTLE